VLAVSFGIASPSFAQFTSGSSGIHGAFPPTALPSGTNYIVLNVTTGLGRYCSVYDITNRPETCTTELGTFQLTGIPVGGLKTGILEFTNVNLAPGNTQFLEVYFVGNSLNNPLTILSQNDIRLGGPTGTFHLKVDGLSGRNPPNVSFSGAGGDPGPGGSPGGSGGAGGSTPGNGNQGFGPAGGTGGAANAATAAALRGVSAGSSPASFSLTPLRGGSGGGGGAGINPVNSLGCGTAILGYGGAGGGGGGGGLTMAATNEIFLGASGATQIDASGGPGGDNTSTVCRPTGGGGEGGSVRLISKTLTGAGSIVLSGGTVPSNLAAAAAGGKIRIEANSNTYTGAITGAGGGSFTQFPGAPIPSDLPTLRITSIAGVATPAAPTGSLTVPDVNFATAPVNPASISLAATKIPIGTTVSVRVTAAIGAAVTVTSTALTGTFDNSTATASVDIPPGQGQIAATVAFTLPPQSAMLMGLPNLDGTKPQHVEVVAGGEGASRVYLVAENGARFEIGGR
jgi:hypothetical protein